MQAALERAYSNCLFTGKYPSCVLYIETSYGSVDVNVHPTKTEVKFSDESSVFSAVYTAALGALGSEDKTGTADIAISGGTERAVFDKAPLGPMASYGGTGHGNAFTHRQPRLRRRFPFRPAS